MRQDRPEPTPERKGVAREMARLRQERDEWEAAHEQQHRAWHESQARVAELEAELALARRIPSAGYCRASPEQCIHFNDDTLCIDCTKSPYFSADDMAVGT